MVERTNYLAFGATESDFRPQRWNHFREDYKFTGKEEDIEVGLTYFGARYYQPYLGRFASPDPLTVHGLGSDLNPYAYVHGRVTTRVDPFGLDDNGIDEVRVPGTKEAPGGSPGLVGAVATGVGAAWDFVRDQLGGVFGSGSSKATPRRSPPPTAPNAPSVVAQAADAANSVQAATRDELAEQMIAQNPLLHALDTFGELSRTLTTPPEARDNAYLATRLALMALSTLATAGGAGVEAAASRAPGVVTSVAGAAEGVATRGAGAAGEQGFTTLFRTVSEGEATSIQSAGRYSAAPGGVEGKYFYPTAEQAANLAKANFPSQGVQTLTSVRVPNALLNQATPLHVAGEGHVYFFNGQQVPQLAAPSVWTYFPLP